MGSLRHILGGLLLCLSVSAEDNATSCVTRRCWASQLIAKNIVSQPQSPSCNTEVTVANLRYETIAVDTKKMHVSSRLTMKLRWHDPDLSWNETVYNFSIVVLPASKVWTPVLSVDNAVTVNTTPVSGDVVVDSDGFVEYSINMYTTVKCSINIFTYPIVTDYCPVPLNGWTNKEGCGLYLLMDENSLTWSGGNAAEWITKSVDLSGSGFRTYLYVELTVSPFNPVVGLLMPSVLILVADIMSCMLPLSGERNGFKVTLVLSFTMFLVLLTEQLPDSGSCSPLIRYHFLISLLLLVLSMLSSLLLTRMSAGYVFLLCGCRKATENKQEKGNEEVSREGALDTVSEVEGTFHQRVLSFLETKQQKKHTENKTKAFAEKCDQAFLVLYVCICICYTIAMLVTIQQDICKENNLDFWTDFD
ncbi:5-hydroxytryptamine receptor 3A-like isoform X2 [Sardina pilchardus]|uniref:5-hydroxytryptamine receptor 3A-like isoform X2 n=1 Tax=Sardina pilchardus TaxID=27697 RepID=UPI002E0D9C42